MDIYLTLFFIIQILLFISKMKYLSAFILETFCPSYI